MNNTAPNILIVDDEPDNLAIISEYLEDDYRLHTAEDGEMAWRMLESEPERFDVILLDRMMPNMNGMEVLTRVKEHAVLKQCPVILQTARAAKEDILEGMKAGAYYYLTKPFDEDMLFSVVKTAVRERQNFKDLQHTLQESTSTLELMDFSKFRFQNLEQVRRLASLLANACPVPENVALVLSELMINAVEHGNLGITYQEKSVLVKQEIWEDEVGKRLSLEKNWDRYASIEFQRCPNCIEFTIRDQGKGFDWDPYMQMSWERATDSHGRGIAMAGLVSFSRVEYRGCGNEVVAVVDCPPLPISRLCLTQHKNTHCNAMIPQSAQHNRSILSAALRDAEDHKFALDSLALVSITDPSGRLTYVNDKFCDTSGYSRGELIGQKYLILFSDQHSETDWEQMLNTAAQGKPWRGNVCKRAKDGSLFWVDSTVIGYRGDGNRIDRFVFINTDITARISLEETRQRLLTILETSPDLIATFDLVGNLQYLNRSGRKFLGWDNQTDLSEQNLRSIFPASEIEKLLNEGIPTASMQNTWSGETQLNTADGRVTDVEN